MFCYGTIEIGTVREDSIVVSQYSAADLAESGHYTPRFHELSMHIHCVLDSVGYMQLKRINDCGQLRVNIRTFPSLL